MSLYRRVSRLWKSVQQISSVPHIPRDVHWCAGQDKAAYTGWPGQHVGSCKHRAPRVAVQMDLIQPESLSHLANLLNKAFDRPERAVFGTIRLAAAKLVVEDDRALVSEALQRLQI